MGHGMPSWLRPRCRALAPHMVGELLSVLPHRDSTDNPLHCRVKGQSCTVNYACEIRPPCCICVSRSGRHATLSPMDDRRDMVRQEMGAQ